MGHTSIGGLPQVETNYSYLNDALKTGFFTDEKTKRSNPMSSPDRINANTWQLNARNELSTSMNEVAGILADGQRLKARSGGGVKSTALLASSMVTDVAVGASATQAATQALIAFRDYRDNFSNDAINSLAVPFDVTEKSMRDMFAMNHIPVPSPEEIAKIEKFPRLPLYDMSHEELRKQHDFDLGGARYRDIVRVEGTKDVEFTDEAGVKHTVKVKVYAGGPADPTYKKIEGEVYRQMNSFEYEVAKAGENTEPKSQQDISAVSNMIWTRILNKPSDPDITKPHELTSLNTESISAFGEILAGQKAEVDANGNVKEPKKNVHGDRNPAISIALAFQSYYHDPELYGSTRKDADRQIQVLLKDHPELIKDLERSQATSAVPTVRDQPYGAARSEEMGVVVGLAIQTDREAQEAFRKIMGAVSSPEAGREEGRRNAIGAIASLAREIPAPYAKKDANGNPTLPPDPHGITS